MRTHQERKGYYYDFVEWGLSEINMKNIIRVLLIFVSLMLFSAGSVYSASLPELNSTSVQMQKGETFKLKLKGVKAKNVKWSSKNKKVATVKNGLVTAKEAGSTEIIAKYRKHKYQCEITVTEPVDSSEEEISELILTVDGIRLDVEWENSESIAALMEMAPITIHMQEYGGFEQTGKIDIALPSNDKKITTKPGDIVLYNSNQICLYFNENTWAFTRLGRITGMSDKKIKELLDKDSVTAVFSIEGNSGLIEQNI